METITNKKVQVDLDKEMGQLTLTGLLNNTVVFLYDSQGELKIKCNYTPPSITIDIPSRGVYVLVISHPNCQPEVRRITY